MYAKRLVRIRAVCCTPLGTENRGTTCPAAGLSSMNLIPCSTFVAVFLLLRSCLGCLVYPQNAQSRLLSSLARHWQLCPGKHPKHSLARADRNQFQVRIFGTGRVPNLCASELKPRCLCSAGEVQFNLDCAVIERHDQALLLFADGPENVWVSVH